MRQGAKLSGHRNIRVDSKWWGRLRMLLRAQSLAILVSLMSLCTFGQPSPKRLFTAADDVGLTLFDYAGRRPPGGVIKFSPDGRYFAVVTEQGRLELNAPEDAIWIFRTEEVQTFVRRPGQPAALSPLRLVRMATDKDGPIIENVRWLDDSSGIAFTALQKSVRCKFRQLFVVDIETHALKALTPDDQDVSEFDIRGKNYVYQVRAPQLLSPRVPADQQTA